MFEAQPLAAPAIAPRAVVIDLIGDLDETLASLAAERIEALALAGTTDLVVTTRYIAVPSHDGVVALGAACARVRRGGCRIALEAGNRSMRAAFTTASISFDAAPRRDASDSRRLLIGRHAPARTADVATR